MENHQWELRDPDGGVEITFGTAGTGYQTAHAPILSEQEMRTTDREAVREDGSRFGVDYTSGKSVSFDLNVLGADWTEQSDRLDRLSGIWRARKWRNDPGAYAVLASRAAGRTRLCYGRPRRYSEADEDLTHMGYTPVVMDFATYDGTFYDEAVQTSKIYVVPPSSAGFTTPITVIGTDPSVAFQTETLDPDEIPGSVVVEGNETWPWLEIYGPVTNPSIELGDFTISLDLSIADGAKVTLDPRPWVRRAVRWSNGGNIAGRLTYDTPPMGEWLLQPGTYRLVYRGTDPTGTSFVEVNWRTAHHHP